MYSCIKLNRALVRKLHKNNTAKLLLLACLNHLDDNNTFKGSHEDLGVTRYAFITGIQALKKADIVRKLSKTTYMFNPTVIIPSGDLDFIKYTWTFKTSEGLRGKYVKK